MSARRENRLLTYAAIVVAGLLLWNGMQGHETISAKRDDQRDARADLDRYIESYQALLPVNKRWNEIYKDASSIKDMNRAYKLIDVESVGLSSSPDRMATNKVASVAREGIEIGLVKLCPSAGNAKGFAVSAPSTSLLIQGIEKLAQRKDIELEYVAISQKEGKVEAVLGLCLLVKDGI